MRSRSSYIGLEPNLVRLLKKMKKSGIAIREENRSAIETVFNHINYSWGEVNHWVLAPDMAFNLAQIAESRLDRTSVPLGRRSGVKFGYHRAGPRAKKGFTAGARSTEIIGVRKSKEWYLMDVRAIWLYRNSLEKDLLIVPEPQSEILQEVA